MSVGPIKQGELPGEKAFEVRLKERETLSFQGREAIIHRVSAVFEAILAKKEELPSVNSTHLHDCTAPHLLLVIVQSIRVFDRQRLMTARPHPAPSKQMSRAGLTLANARELKQADVSRRAQDLKTNASLQCFDLSGA